MARREAFKQHDLTRAIKGATAGGLSVVRVEIEPNGRLSIITGKDGLPFAEHDVSSGSPFEAWRAKNAGET